MDHQTSVEIPSEELSAALKKLNEVYELLNPYMAAAGPDTPAQLPVLHKQDFPFVEKAMEYIKLRPELSPYFVDIIEMESDWRIVKDMMTLLQQIQRLSERVSSSMGLAGAEVYGQAISYHHMVKAAAEKEMNGAAAIERELSKLAEVHSDLSHTKEANL